MLLRTSLSMGPPLLRFSWVLHTQARASDVSNHLLSHHSLPRMTTSWDPYSCSKTLCNEGHSPSCSQRHWTNTSAPWSALVLILHTNSWDRNTFSTLEEFSAEDFLQNLESRGSVSDCQLALLPPLERDEVKPEFVSEACPSLHVAALWKAPLLELTQQCTVLCLRVPDSLPQVGQTRRNLEARGPEPNVHPPLVASQANVPVSLPLVGRKSVMQNN